MYGMPEEIDVKAEGPLRIITLNRPDALNAVNDNLHVGLAGLWDRLNEDADARVAVLTGPAARSRPVATSTTSTNSAGMRRCAPRPSSTVATS